MPSVAGSPAPPRTRRIAIVAAALGLGVLAGRSQVSARLRTVPQRLRGYRKAIGEITASVSGVYRGLTGLPDTPPNDAIRLIWLSDVHNNPMAYDAARALAEQYDGAIVIDTGDAGDWGRDFEARTFAAIAQIPAPYVFIKGNHDGPRTIEQFRALPNVVVLDGGAIHEHRGLRIAGDSDPRFTPDKSTGDDHFPLDELRRRGTALAMTLRGAAPDVVLVHDPATAAQLGGVAPLVLCGHTHRRAARVLGETLMLTQGSSGGAGLRGVRQDPPKPLDISVLHLDARTKRLHSVDELSIGGLGRTTVTLVRRSAADVAAGTGRGR